MMLKGSIRVHFYDGYLVVDGNGCTGEWLLGKLVIAVGQVRKMKDNN